MSNMSYCRFENTEGDLRDCLEAIDEALERGRSLKEFTGKMSEQERSAFHRMQQTCEQTLRAIEELKAAREMKREYVLIEVRNGILEFEIGTRAVTCAGEQLADGFYFLPDVETDPPHRRPFKTREAAEEAAIEWLEEQNLED